MKSKPDLAMVLFCTALHEQKKIKIFSFQPSQLELGLDIVNIINAQGYAVLSAHIVDENGATPIPIEVFDGNPFSAPIQSLEKEWKKLLNKPVKKKVIQHLQTLTKHAPIKQTKRDHALSQLTDEMLVSLRQSVQRYKEYIINLDAVINRLNKLIDLSKRFNSFHSVRNYQLLINKNEVRIAKATDKLKLLTNKLHRLEYDS